MYTVHKIDMVIYAEEECSGSLFEIKVFCTWSLTKINQMLKSPKEWKISHTCC